MKWVEISLKKNENRFQKLSKFLNENGIENTLEFIECTEDDFFDQLTEAQKNYDQIKIGLDFGVQALKYLTRNPAEIETIGAADTFYHESGQWWMRSYYAQAFKGLLSQMGSTLNLNQSILIVGTNSLARIAFSMLTKVGFKKVSFASTSSEEGLVLITHLEKKYFDVEVKYLFMDDLVMLSGEHTVLLNTLVYTEKSDEFFKELYFFNFLHTGALVWDFTSYEEETQLIKEAKMAEFMTLSGEDLYARADLEWVRSLTGRSFDLVEYLQY